MEKTTKESGARAKAVVGGENDAEKLNTPSEQNASKKKGPGKSRMEPQPDASAGTDNPLGMRGMSSAGSAKFWKESGYKVPTGANEGHFGGKKPGS